MTHKPPRLVRSHYVDLPVVEASGLAARRTDDALRVLAVGDRTAHLAVSTYAPASGLGDWQTIDLSLVPGWPVPADDSQLEAIAVDGGCLVALMREDPPVVLVADTEQRALVAQITLTAPSGSPLAGRWDDPSSRGEGLVLLRNGRLLVAKEKRPRALVEFAPAGARAGGLSRRDFLAPGESWEAPTGETRVRSDVVVAATREGQGRAPRHQRARSWPRSIAVAPERQVVRGRTIVAGHSATARR